MSVTIKVENIGYLKFELHCEQAPQTCKNFLGLCAADYYIGTKFHRNIKGFILQGGDPTGTGKGGQSIYSEGKPFADEIVEGLIHDKRGVLSMANSGADKNTSQFFITYGKHTSLDKRFTVFGQLIDGFESLERLECEPVDDKTMVPLNSLTISETTVHANPIADAEFIVQNEEQ